MLPQIAGNLARSDRRFGGFLAIFIGLGIDHDAIGQLSGDATAGRAASVIGTVGKEGHFEPAAPLVKFDLSLPRLPGVARRRVSG
jgi:hypothetical protein